MKAWRVTMSDHALELEVASWQLDLERIAMRSHTLADLKPAMDEAAAPGAAGRRHAVAGWHRSCARAACRMRLPAVPG
jgi:hypothetical protein